MDFSRRTILRRGAIVATLLGVGLTTATGQVAAMNKAELIEAMASQAGISSEGAAVFLDAFVNATTTALKKGDRVALVGFGSFSVSKRARRERGTGHEGDSSVGFDACPAFASALDLIPGEGDDRRAPASSRCLDVDVVIDADRIAKDTNGGKDGGLSKADAKKALEGFINATTKVLNRGDTVSLVGFGSFSISKRSARTGRNPQTGKEIKIAARSVVTFKAGAELSKAVK